MAKPPAPTSEFVRLPADEWVRVEIVEATVGKSPFKDEKTGEFKINVKIVMEATEPEYERARAWTFPNFTIGEKAKLRKVAQAALGSDFDAFEFDTDDLVGRQLLIMGNYGDDPDGSYLKVDRFKAVGGSASTRRPAPQPEPDPQIDDLDDI